MSGLASVDLWPRSHNRSRNRSQNSESAARI